MASEFYTLSPAMGREQARRRPLGPIVRFDTSPDRPKLLPVVTSIAQGLKRALPIAQQTADALREFASSKRPHPAAQPDVAPWTIAYERFSILEPVLRERILAISVDESAFSAAGFAQPVAATVAAVKGEGGDEPRTLDESEMVPMARAALNEDARLSRLRYKLVPAAMSEAAFWRSYFM